MKKFLISTCILSLITASKAYAGESSAKNTLVASSGYHSDCGYKGFDSGYKGNGGYKGANSSSKSKNSETNKDINDSTQQQIEEKNQQGLPNDSELAKQMAQLQKEHPEQVKQMLKDLQIDPEFLNQMKQLQKENPEQAKQIQQVLQKLQEGLEK